MQNYYKIYLQDVLSFDEIITAARRYKMPITSVRRHEIDKLKKKAKIKITKKQGGDHTVIFFLFFLFGLIPVSKKPMIKVLFNDFVDYRNGISIFGKIRSNTFYVIIKRVPVVAKFKRPIYLLSLT